MKNLIKKLTVATIITAFALTGCGKSEATTVKADFANKGEFGEVYELTALVSVPSSNISNNVTTKTGDSGDVKVEDCGNLTTVNEKYHLPSITADENVTYISPIIGNVEVKSVKFVKETKEEKETLGDAATQEGSPAEETTKTEEDTKTFVEETKVKVDGKETKAFLVKHAGVYEAEIGEEKITLTVKEGSLFDDMINGNTAKNILVNKDSKEVSDRVSEYDNTLPLLVQSYLEKYKTEEEAINALKNENADILKEYNRIRKLKGEEPLSVNDIVATFKDKKVEEAIVSATPSKRGVSVKANAVRSGVNTETSGNNGSLAYQAFTLINNIRTQNGKPALRWEGAGVSAIRAEEIVKNFSHTSASGQRFDGENIAQTASPSASHVVDLWMASAGHRANILNGNYGSGSLAVVESGGNYYWVNNFTIDLQAINERNAAKNNGGSTGGTNGGTSGGSNGGSTAGNGSAPLVRNDDGNITAWVGSAPVDADGYAVAGLDGATLDAAASCPSESIALETAKDRGQYSFKVDIHFRASAGAACSVKGTVTWYADGRVEDPTGVWALYKKCEANPGFQIKIKLPKVRGGYGSGIATTWKYI